MRVLVAPDGFGGTLSAVEAAAAMAAGWSAARPGDVVEQAPQSDGGPGFLDALASQGTLRESAVAGPLGRAVPASWLSAPDGTAYIEVASACGLHLVTGGPTPRCRIEWIRHRGSSQPGVRAHQLTKPRKPRKPRKPTKPTGSRTACNSVEQQCGLLEHRGDVRDKA